MTNTYKPSALQEAIAHEFTNSDKNLMVIARAGSGKTSTLCMLATLVPPRKTACFVAFNKGIADALANKLPSVVKAATCHSIGFSEIRQRMRSCKVETKKVSLLIKQKYGLSYESSRFLCDLVSAAKNHGFLSRISDYSPDQQGASALILDAIDNFDMIIPEDFPMMIADEMLLSVLRASNEDLTTIDFDDMIYLPISYNWHLTKYDYLFVDEAQDLSPLQHAFVLKLGRRFTFVGDDKQAIYSFRGADSDSMRKLQEQTQAVPLPLNVSYRCPKNVIRDAQLIVHDIEAFKTEHGTVENIGTANLYADLAAGHVPPTAMVICRNNKPLFNIALHCLRNRIAFRISSNFNVSLVKRIKSFKATTIQQLEVRTKKWAETEIEKAEQKNRWGIVARTEELLDIILDFCAEAREKGETNVSAVTSLIEAITMGASGILLTTIHKGKGLEAPTVYFLYPGLLPSKYAVSEAAIQQEMNLKYVAITRAEETLYYVE